MTINEIYESVQTIANKKLSGAISPQEFNQLAAVVSNDLFKLKSGNPEDYQLGVPITKQGWQLTYTISDSLKHLVVERDIAKDANNLFPYPTGYAVFSSLKVAYITDDCDSELIWTRVEVVTDGELSVRLESQLIPPTPKRPIGAYYAGGFRIYPEVYTNARLTYLRYPTPPNWNFNVTNDQAIFNPVGSVNFDFPETLHSDIIIRICRYIGINLRENDLVEYSLQRQNAGT